MTDSQTNPVPNTEEREPASYYICQYGVGSAPLEHPGDHVSSPLDSGELREQLRELFDEQTDYLKAHDTLVDKAMQLIGSYAQTKLEEAELVLLTRVEQQGDGEAKRQGAGVHNMDAYHRAYGEIVSHNVHNRIAQLKASNKQGEGE